MYPASLWERTYLEYETSDQEIRKFLRRIGFVGVGAWDRNLRIAELFCGRGSGLHAWDRLGFRNLSGLDLSARMLSEYRGPHQCFVADARDMPFTDASFDVVSINGGLHHLETLSDIEKVITEVHRILRPGGRLIAFEPWLTPFRKTAHFVSGIKTARRISRRVDTFARLIELEGPAYPGWLARQSEILAILQARLTPEICSARWGRLRFLGTRA